jgi:hypothetical protein
MDVPLQTYSETLLNQLVLVLAIADVSLHALLRVMVKGSEQSKRFMPDLHRNLLLPACPCLV